MQWYNVDDAFFYFKVAQNALAGHGFTFDGINLTNGFHPLWMAVCLGVFWLSKYNLLLPLRVLVVVSGLLNAASSLLLFRFLKRYIHPWAALSGALLWGLYPPIFDSLVTHGMESTISAFFIILLLFCAARYLDDLNDKKLSIHSLIWLGLVGAFTILARLDNLFVVGVVGIFLLLKIKKIAPMVIFDIMMVTFSVFAAWIIRLGSEGVVQNTYTIYPMLVVALLVKPICLYFSACYTTKISLERIKTVFRMALALIISSIIEYAILMVSYKLNIIKMFSNTIAIIYIAISFILVFLVHLLLGKPVSTTTDSPFSILGSWVKNNWKSTLSGGLAYAAPIAFLVGVYMIFNKITLGTFSPVSGQIKHWWNTLINSVYSSPTNLLSVLGLSTSGANGPWSLITSLLFNLASFIAKPFKALAPEIILGFLLIIILVFFVLLMKAENGKLASKFFRLLIPAILIGSVIHITYYTATGYIHTRVWYWGAEMITLVIICSLVLDGVFSWVDKLKFKFSPFLVIFIVFFLVRDHIQYVTSLSPLVVPKVYQTAYVAETRAVESYTEPNSKIGMTGGGLVAYFIQNRTVVNLDGLINSMEYFNAMKSGTATQFLDKLPLNYVYGKPYMLLGSDPYETFLKDRLVEIGYIRGNEGFTLYKYVIK
jgi:hypothetical protein